MARRRQSEDAEPRPAPPDRTDRAARARAEEPEAGPDSKVDSDSDSADGQGAVPRGSAIPRGEATAHDTEADAREARRRAPVAERPPSDGEPEVSEAPVPALPPRPKANLPRSRARLAAVRVHEAATRRRYDAARAGRDPRAPHASQVEAPRVELSFARVLDGAQRAFRVEQDGVRVFGTATGHDREGAPSRATIGLVDGSAFSVRVDAGATSRQTVERLAARLASHFVAEVHEEAPDVTFLRLVRALAGP